MFTSSPFVSFTQSHIGYYWFPLDLTSRESRRKRSSERRVSRLIGALTVIKGGAIMRTLGRYLRAV